MNVPLSELLARARLVNMTSDQKQKQRLSFAYGNANIENPQVTRDSIDSAAEKIAKESSCGTPKVQAG